MAFVAWIGVLALLTWLFQNKLWFQENPNTSIESRKTDQAIEIVLERNRMGHYLAEGTINGERVRFLVDTGATFVSIPSSLAEKLNLQPGFARQSKTANGTITTYDVRLNTVTLGDIRQDNVVANLNPHMQDSDVLLGMSFLKHLELIQRDGQLTLRQLHANHQ